MTQIPYAGLLERLGDIQDIIAAAEMQFATTEAHHTYYADRHAAITEAAEAISSLLKALDELQAAERDYRKFHDLHGPGDIITGRAWDQMRRAGDKARAALSGEKL